MSRKFPFVIFLVAMVLCVIPIISVRAAGGSIEGKITDPQGAAIVGASITVTEATTNKRFTAVTDAQGRFKIEALPAGTYTLAVSAKGFKDSTRDSIKVSDGAVAQVDIPLDVAPVEANVNVPAGPRANSDPVYQQLRAEAKTDADFSGPYATVSNLVLERDGANFNLHSGEIYFLTPIENRNNGAVYIGDGELVLTPPTEIEKNSLKIFTDQPTLTEQFSSLVIRFTDKTFDEIKASANAKMNSDGPLSSRARSLFHDQQQLVRKQLRDNRDLRVLSDIYAPDRPGFFNAFIDGRRYNKLIYIMDPLGIPEVAPEEVALLSYGESDGGIWTAFHRIGEYKAGKASSSEDHRLIDITHHEIDGTIKGTRIIASDRISFTALANARVVPLNLFGSLRVSRAQDEQGTDLNFVQENKDEDSDLGVIFPHALEPGKTYQMTITYDGEDALRDSGGGNFILLPRLTWYPNSGSVFGDRAIFDMTFRYPKSLTFVGTGAPTGPETREGDQNVAKWSSGSTELAVAGFNYGKFKKKETADKDTGYNIEFYANQEVPDELKEIQMQIEQMESQGMKTTTTLGVISTTKMADMALADAQNSTRIYDAFFGKLPYTRLAMTQQPAGFFGQAWPTLVFMPYIAFIDTTQRAQLLGVRGGTNNFWRYVAPHEIAHQWWGHVVGWDSYHDQWMSEGFAEFSASLYVQLIRGNEKFLDFWEDQRKRIIESTPATKDRKPYTVGPVTQGYRLNTGKTGSIARSLIYPKGAYILHMLRMMMYNRQNGDKNFQDMMKDFVQSHFNKDVSTEDFKAIVEKHMSKEMDVGKNGTMDWFFDEWVYGTEMPSYRFDYQVTTEGLLSGRVTQSGVSDQFAMLVPVYVDFGKGWAKLGMATLIGNSSVDLKNIKLPSAPKKVAICVMNDVLATSIQNK